MAFTWIVCSLFLLMNLQFILAQKEIGDSCSPTSIINECLSIPNAVCRDRICTCLDRYVASPDGTRCLLKVDHGDICEETVQCNYTQNSECLNQRCACKVGFYYRNGFCVGNKTLNEDCEIDAECIVRNDEVQRTVWCYSNQCICKSGFKKEKDICVIGGDCENKTGDCSELENSYCNTNLKNRYQCACIDSYIAAVENTKCLPIVHEYGGYCEDVAQCSESIGKTQCKDRRCVCADGVTLDAVERHCNAAIINTISLLCFALITLTTFL